MNMLMSWENKGRKNPRYIPKITIASFSAVLLNKNIQSSGILRGRASRRHKRSLQ